MLQSINITSKRQYKESEICRGNPVSSTSMSLANYPIMRPVGVVSKNMRGALIIARNIYKCMTLAALQQPNCGASSEKYDAKAASNKIHIFPTT